MTIQELGQTVKQKHSQYQGYSDQEIGERVLKKYPVYQSKITEESKKKSLLSKVGGFVADVTGAKGIYEVLKKGVTTKEPLTKLIPQTIGSAAKMGLTLGTFGTASPLTLGGRIAVGTSTGAGFGASEALEKQKSAKDIGKSALVGGALGAGTVGAAELLKWTVKGVPKLLSYTSDTPERVLQRQYDNPSLAAKSLKQVLKTGPEGVQKNVQGAAKNLRTSLSQQYDEGSKILIQQNEGARINLGSKAKILADKLSKEIGLDIPQNMNNVSVKEGLQFNKNINELLYDLPFKDDRRFIAKQLKDILSSKLGGFSGIKEFLSNYGTEKQVLDAADAIVKAYKANNPISQTTSLSRLSQIFSENKPAYYSALKDLEEKTGIPILDQVASLKLLKKLPRGSLVHHFLGGMAKLAAIPITSPRSAGFLSRSAGRLGQKTGQGTLQKMAIQIFGEKGSQ